MSAADGAETLQALENAGWQKTDDVSEADAVVLTTCTVRAHAEHRAISMIGRLRTWKDADPRRMLVVTGCVAERLGPRLTQRFPHVDLVVGAREAARTPQIVAELLGKRFQPQPKTAPVKNKICACVTIMRGCDCACSYCIVPSVRGPEACRPLEDILSEMRDKIAAGAKEITLLGQRVNAYRESGKTFADLLRRADCIEGLARLRFMSPHPALMDEKTFTAIRDGEHICPAIHIPVQSGNDRVLALMKRGHTRRDFLEMIQRLRQAVPGVVLSTDIIVGFPSETEEDFAQSLTLLEELKPAAAFCFKYSAREGTPSARLKDDVPVQVKEDRLGAVNALVSKLAQAALHSQIGSEVEVLAETPDFGRTRTGFKARWKQAVAPGSLLRLQVAEVSRRTLSGEISS